MVRSWLAWLVPGLCAVSASYGANLAITGAHVCNEAGESVSPRAGERFWICVEYTYTDPVCDDYVIRRSVDGQTIDAPALNWGCGYSGVTYWYHSWGTWRFDQPGTYLAQITLDTLNAIAETDESDNTLIIPVDVLSGADASLPRLSWPVAGQMGVDVSACTFFDDGVVDSSWPYFCEPWTYGGHSGSDFGNGGFEAMDLGPVPVFAALPGTVVSVVDGYYDRRTDCNHGDPDAGNMIEIDHGNNITTLYAHLQVSSMAVSVGDSVVAGQQIATVGSSGCSSGPHLHFEVRRADFPFDPFVGPCNPAPQLTFADQPPVATRAMVDTYISAQCDGDEPPPHYFFRPSETLVTINAFLSHLALGSVVEWQWYQNGGQFAHVTLDPFTAYGCGGYWRWCFFRPGGEGPGSVRTLVDGEIVWEQPYLAVSDTFEIPSNSPPTQPMVEFQYAPHAGRPTWVTLAQASFDPDHDAIRYEYDWFVDDQAVRTCVTVALTDALPADLEVSGQAVRCRVTPYDDAGPGTSNEVTSEFLPLADLDGDASVELDDFTILAGCLHGPMVFTAPPGSNPTDFVAADLDWDDDVDLRDFATFQRFYGE